MDSTKIGVFEQSYQVSFGSLLQGQNGRPLETQIGLEVLRDLTNQTLEGKLTNQQISRLLVTTNLTESDGSRAVTMRLFDTAGCRWYEEKRAVSRRYAGVCRATYWQVRSYERPWWRAACEELFLRWTCVLFVWFGPWFQFCVKLESFYSVVWRCQVMLACAILLPRHFPVVSFHVRVWRVTFRTKDDGRFDGRVV